MGAHVHSLAVNPLSLIFGHPCTALLALAGVEVSIEHRKIAAIVVEHLVGLDIGMIHRDGTVLFERDAVEAVGQSEHALDNL